MAVVTALPMAVVMRSAVDLTPPATPPSAGGISIIERVWMQPVMRPLPKPMRVSGAMSHQKLYPCSIVKAAVAAVRTTPATMHDRPTMTMVRPLASAMRPVAIEVTAETSAFGRPIMPAARAEAPMPFWMNRATRTKTEVPPRNCMPLMAVAWVKERWRNSARSTIG